MFSPVRAPRCAVSTLGCGLLFGLWSFLFSSLVPLPGCFCLYLFIPMDDCHFGFEEKVTK
jgi:hypothetical protein